MKKKTKQGFVPNHIEQNVRMIVLECVGKVLADINRDQSSFATINTMIDKRQKHIKDAEWKIREKLSRAIVGFKGSDEYPCVDLITKEVNAYYKGAEDMRTFISSNINNIFKGLFD